MPCRGSRSGRPSCVVRAWLPVRQPQRQVGRRPGERHRVRSSGEEFRGPRVTRDPRRCRSRPAVSGTPAPLPPAPPPHPPGTRRALLSPALDWPGLWRDAPRSGQGIWSGSTLRWWAGVGWTAPLPATTLLNVASGGPRRPVPRVDASHTRSSAASGRRRVPAAAPRGPAGVRAGITGSASDVTQWRPSAASPLPGIVWEPSASARRRTSVANFSRPAMRCSTPR